MKIIFCLFLLLTFVPMNLDGHEHHHEEDEVSIPVPEDSGALREIGASYLREIKPIFERTCFDCHSNRTRFPAYYRIPGIKQWIDSDIREAKKHIDMTNGFPFKGHGTPQKDFEAIRKTILEDDMPPWDYWLMHPKARLSTGDKEMILRWIHEGQELLTH